jgi:hypothetical protein
MNTDVPDNMKLKSMNTDVPDNMKLKSMLVQKALSSLEFTPRF